MKSIADQLPPEIARQIHPDRRKVDYKPGENVPVIIEGREITRIAVADLLPRRP